MIEKGYKLKTINSIVCKKFGDFLDSIEDEEVKKLVSENTIITGGCITSLLLKEKVNDFDIYFKDIRTTYEVAKYYFNKMNISEGEVQIVTKKEEKWETINEDYENVLNSYVPKKDEDVRYRVRAFISSKGVEGENVELKDIDEKSILEDLELQESKEEDDKKYKPVFITSNAVTLTNKIQIVLRFYGDPEVIHDNYDFVHVTNYWKSKDRKLYINDKAMESIRTKDLKYIGSRYPFASLGRIKKYIQRGWNINQGQLLKIAFQISELDFNNFDVIEEQLTGVDVHYFSQVLNILHDKIENDKDVDVKSYLLEVIERIFE